MPERKPVIDRRARPWTDAEIERRSVPRDGDIQKADDAWKDHAPADLRTLLDAEELSP